MEAEHVLQYNRSSCLQYVPEVEGVAMIICADLWLLSSACHYLAILK